MRRQPLRANANEMEFDSDTEQLDESHSKETPRGSVSEPRSSNNTN